MRFRKKQETCKPSEKVVVRQREFGMGRSSASARWVTRLCAMLLGLGANASAVQAQPTAAAATASNVGSVVRRAEALFAARNYDSALAEFNRAYDLLAGDPRQYRVLNNIAVCQERLFRYDLALHYYRRYLAEGASDPADRAGVTAAIRTLEGLLGTLRISSNVPASVWLDDRRVGKAPGSLLVPGGRHVLELRTHLYEPARREFSLAARSTLRLHMHLTPLSQYRGLQPGFFWIATALTVGALVGGSVLGAMALHADDDARARAAQSPFFNEPDDREHVRNLALSANLAFAAAGVFAVTSLLLYFLTDWQAEPERVSAVPWPRGVGRGVVARGGLEVRPWART